VEFDECCDYVDWCIRTLVDLLTVVNNCIHLVNLIDDNYFCNSNEVRIVYVYTYDVVISVIMMIACL